jgi:hypothetical protein
MRTFKIVETKNGHGDSGFQIKAKCGWGWFCFWEKWGSRHNTMEKATNKIKVYINDEKDNQKIKVKEYVYTTVPNHVPKEQVGKFMELNHKKI